MSAFFLYTLFYILISGCIIYPPTEFVSAGLTIKDIFSSWLGSENELFVFHHMRRSMITLFIHSILPLGYVYGLRLFGHYNTTNEFFDHTNLWLILLICAALIPIYVLYKILTWSVNDCHKHPTAQNLAMYCNFITNNNRRSWNTIARCINAEYHRVNKIKIVTNSVTCIVVTDNWIMKVLPYKLLAVHQNEAVLIVNKTDTHEMSPVTRGGVQFINIKVIPTRTGLLPFDIRLRAQDFKNLQEKLSRPIIILQNITFHRTVLDEFIAIFKQQVQQNLNYEWTEELEQCIGCVEATSNIKLHKQCSTDMENGNHQACMRCNCRPMWCIDCMAKWFASRQDENAPETWLSSKCTCPVCRMRFCILDVCFIQQM